jgi:t-SNARE complex subunit (syntaxin)
MFLDFALLTEQQGELLDQIEFQVKSAGDYIEQANEEVVEAIEISKKVRKKQWYVYLLYSYIKYVSYQNVSEINPFSSL